MDARVFNQGLGMGRGHGDGQVHWAGQLQDTLLNIIPQSKPDLSSNYPNPRHLRQQARIDPAMDRV